MRFGLMLPSYSFRDLDYERDLLDLWDEEILRHYRPV